MKTIIAVLIIAILCGVFKYRSCKKELEELKQLKIDSLFDPIHDSSGKIIAYRTKYMDNVHLAVPLLTDYCKIYFVEDLHKTFYYNNEKNLFTELGLKTIQDIINFIGTDTASYL